MIQPDTILATTVHPLQVMDEPLPETIHDFRVDLIVTPDETIWCAEPHRPPGILWNHLDPDKIAEVPVLAALAAQRSPLVRYLGEPLPSGCPFQVPRPATSVTRWWLPFWGGGQVAGTELVTIRIDDKTSIVAEVDPADLPSEFVLASTKPGETVAYAGESLETALDHLKPAISAIITSLRSAAQVPDAVEVEFGLKIGGEMGIIFAKGTVEANIKVNLTWANHPVGAAEDQPPSKND